MTTTNTIIYRNLIQFISSPSNLGSIMTDLHNAKIELVFFVEDKGLTDTNLIKIIPKSSSDVGKIHNILVSHNVSHQTYLILSVPVTTANNFSHFAQIYKHFSNITIFTLAYETFTNPPRLIIDIDEKFLSQVETALTNGSVTL